LGGTDWSSVSEATNVDEAYDIFWKSYTDLFELNFPKKRSRFNKNIHKRSPFMTAGLLVSRKTKNLLFKLQLENNSEENIQKYKNFKQIYARTLRAAKKLYFKKKLQDNIKNPKKTWDTLNEVLGKEKSKDSIEKIDINGNISNDPSEIANHFNSFFTKIGKNISNSIPPHPKKGRGLHSIWS
jgi:hypothetical protein